MNSAKPLRCIFFHHSTGGHLIAQGEVRELLVRTKAPIDLWDQGYDPSGSAMMNIKSLFTPSSYGLRDGSGQVQAENIHISGNNTNPDGLSLLFSQPIQDHPKNALSFIMRFDCVMFKSCYPVTAIASDGQLEAYKQYYQTIRVFIDSHPDTLFIPMTPPPLRASLTTKSQADRARRFSQWLVSQEFCGERRNLKPYDFFDALATSESDAVPNVLRPEFSRRLWLDSHPNRYANVIVAPRWVDHIVKSVEGFAI